MIALGMGLLSVDHQCIMSVSCIYLYVYNCLISEKASFPKTNHGTRGSLAVLERKARVSPIWFSGRVLLSPCLERTTPGCVDHHSVSSFWYFFSNMVGLGWSTKSVPQIIWHFTEKCQVILGIHDMDHQWMTSWTSWRRETKILRFQ